MKNAIMIGQFVLALVPFHEDPSKSKFRPILILDTAVLKNGDVVYLAAPESTKVEKCRGDLEVIIHREASHAIGMDAEAVLRFSRDSLVAVMAKDVAKVFGHYKKLSPELQLSIEHAAKSIGC